MSNRQHLLQDSLGVLTYKDTNSIFKVILTTMGLLKKGDRRKKKVTTNLFRSVLKAIFLAGILEKKLISPAQLTL